MVIEISIVNQILRKISFRKEALEAQSPETSGGDSLEVITNIHITHLSKEKKMKKKSISQSLYI